MGGTLQPGDTSTIIKEKLLAPIGARITVL
jgi:hypothetical protein